LPEITHRDLSRVCELHGCEEQDTTVKKSSSVGMECEAETGTGPVACCYTFADDVALSVAADGMVSTWSHVEATLPPEPFTGATTNRHEWQLNLIHGSDIWTDGHDPALAIAGSTVVAAAADVLREVTPCAVVVTDANQGRVVTYSGSGAVSDGFMPLPAFSASATAGGSAVVTAVAVSGAAELAAFGDDHGCCSIRSLADPSRASFSCSLRGGTGPTVHDIKFWPYSTHSLLVAW